MAKTVRDFVKNSLNSYYKNFQVKMGANVDPSINNVHNAIKIANDGSIYIHDAGGFNGYNDNVQNASTLQEILKRDNGGGGIPGELIAGNALNIETNKIIQIGYIQRNDSARLSDMTDITRFHAIDGSDLTKNVYLYKISPEEKDISEITKTIRIEHFANFELYGDLNGETILGIVKYAANGDGKIIAISLQNPSELIPSKTDNPAFIPCYCKKYNLENNKNIVYVTSHIYNSSFNNCTFGSDNFNYAQNANIEGVRNYIDENATGSHAEGYYNTLSAKYSHAEGIHNETTNIAEHAEGQYNQSHEGKTIHSIGIGESEQTRKNAFEVMQDGSIYVCGIGNYDGSTLTTASTIQDIIKNSNDNVEELNTNVNILNTSVNTLNTKVNNLDLDVDTLKANVLNIIIDVEWHDSDHNTIVINNINVNVEDPNWTLSEYKEMFNDIDNDHTMANKLLPNVYGIICPVYITIKDVTNENNLIILKQYGTMRTHVIFDYDRNIYKYVRDITCKGFGSYDVKNSQIIEHYFKFSAELENSTFYDIVRFNDENIWTAAILIYNNI